MSSSYTETPKPRAYGYLRKWLGKCTCGMFHSNVLLVVEIANGIKHVK